MKTLTEQEPVPEPQGRTRSVCRAVGTCVQFFLWWLLFLSFPVAYAMGLRLTDFRYVGF